MEIIKVKDWLKRAKPQFEVVSRYSMGLQAGPIKTVKRLKDDVKFFCFSEVVHNGSEAAVHLFSEDLVNVMIVAKLSQKDDMTESKSYLVPINEIENSPDSFFKILDEQEKLFSQIIPLFIKPKK